MRDPFQEGIPSITPRTSGVVNDRENADELGNSFAGSQSSGLEGLKIRFEIQISRSEVRLQVISRIPGLREAIHEGTHIRTPLIVVI
jgi:hypothetical protein